VGATALATATACICAAPSNPAFAATNGVRIQTAASARTAARHRPREGTESAAARRALRRGYLVPHQASYKRQKQRLGRRTAATHALIGPTANALAPSVVAGKSWRGINDKNATPPDETSAVGTSRYIELVNSSYAIYSKSSNVPLDTGSLKALSGQPGSHFDVQIIWDATTKRFYYAMVDVMGRRNNRIAFGFSRSSSPSSAADWCKYSVGFGPRFPDFPKLGDSRYFAIIGTNLFNPKGGFRGPDLLAISKPPVGARCPAPNSFERARKLLKRSAFTPVPANEIDASATGWAVAIAGSLPATKLRLFKVTRSATGTPRIQSNGTAVEVPTYGVPPNAAEKGSKNKLDTSDARNTQAVAAIDPARGGRLAIWTQHAVRGGAGAQERWYEIDPVSASLLQTGTVTSPSLFDFNGAISPNRLVRGASATGGNTMVMNYDTSSKATFPSIEMVSKVGVAPVSGPVAVHIGTKPLGGFDCRRRFCRWGDYAAATPDPSRANWIWQVSQYAGAHLRGSATSRTWNFVARP
jgi:hypothetical protein